MGGTKLGFIEALGVRVNLGQIRYPEVLKAGISRAENGTFLLCFVFNVFLLDDLSRDIIGCYFHPDCWLLNIIMKARGLPV